MCLLMLSLFLLSACSSEAVKESGSESPSPSESPSEIASEPSDVSEGKNVDREYTIPNGEYGTFDVTDEIPTESVFIMIESDYRIEKLTIRNANDETLFVEKRSLDEFVLKTDMTLFSYDYDFCQPDYSVSDADIIWGQQSIKCYVGPSDSFTAEGEGKILIIFPGLPPVSTNVSEKIVFSRDTITLYGADKENPFFKDREERFGRKIVFAE